MQRRDFLVLGSIFIAGCAAGNPFRSSRSPKRLLVQPYEDTATGKFGIFFFDFEKSDFQHVETRFSVHSVFYDEILEEYIGVNKYGPEYVKFKNFSEKDLNYFSIDKKTFSLSGHAGSVPYDENYYLTGFNPVTGKSGILSLNKKTNAAKVIAEVEVCDPPVHDCKFSKNRDQLFFTSSNNIHSWKLKTAELESRKLSLWTAKSSLRHFEVNSNDELCLQSNIINTKSNYEYENAEIVFQTGAKTETFKVKDFIPKLGSNELLDFSFDQKQKSFACVHNKSKSLSLWKTNPLQPQSVIKFDDVLVRVSNYFDEEKYLVMAMNGFYLVGQSDFKTHKVAAFSGLLKRSYLYGHKTLIQLT